jgi:hypothetical protein
MTSLDQFKDWMQSSVLYICYLFGGRFSWEDQWATRFARSFPMSIQDALKVSMLFQKEHRVQHSFSFGVDPPILLLLFLVTCELSEILSHLWKSHSVCSPKEKKCCILQSSRWHLVLKCCTVHLTARVERCFCLLGFKDPTHFSGMSRLGRQSTLYFVSWLANKLSAIQWVASVTSLLQSTRELESVGTKPYLLEYFTLHNSNGKR